MPRAILPVPLAVPTVTSLPVDAAPLPIAVAALIGCSVTRSTAPLPTPLAASPAPLAAPTPMFLAAPGPFLRSDFSVSALAAGGAFCAQTDDTSSVIEQRDKISLPMDPLIALTPSGAKRIRRDYVVAQRCRSAPPGSLTTRLSSLKTIVGRFWTL